MTKINTLPDGDVLVQQEYFDGEEMAAPPTIMNSNINNATDHQNGLLSNQRK